MQRADRRRLSAQDPDPPPNPRPRRINGTFGPGQPKPTAVGGRPRAKQNRITRDIKRGLVDSAIAHGNDGLGTNGLTGYFEYLLKNDLRAHAQLMGRLMPLQVDGNIKLGINKVEIVEVPEDCFLTRDEPTGFRGYWLGGRGSGRG
jgi:hypothetical protein